jgi:hypothetical protein
MTYRRSSRLAASGLEEAEALHAYTCRGNESYNPAATLLFTSGEKTIEHLLSRQTHYEVRMDENQSMINQDWVTVDPPQPTDPQ